MSLLQRWNGPWLAAGLIYLLILIGLTHLPAKEMPIDLNQFNLDKMIHVAAYAIMTWLFFKSYRPTRNVLGLVSLFCGLIIIALLDEATQSFVNRVFSLYDLAADVAGIMGCFFILLFIQSWYIPKTNLEKG